jgi:hypothetical protein
LATFTKKQNKTYEYQQLTIFAYWQHLWNKLATTGNKNVASKHQMFHLTGNIFHTQNPRIYWAAGVVLPKSPMLPVKNRIPKNIFFNLLLLLQEGSARNAIKATLHNRAARLSQP